MESQPQNPEFRIYPENFHSCKSHANLAAMSFNSDLQLQRRFLNIPQPQKLEPII